MARAKKQKLSLEELLEQAVIKVEEQPYKVPNNWVWTSLGHLLRPMTTKRPTNEDEFFRYIDIEAIDNKRQCISQPKIILGKDAPSRASRELSCGDTLFSLVRPYLKNIAFVKEEYEDCIASTGFYVCKPQMIVYPLYMYHLLCSDYVVNTLNQFMKGDNSPSIRGGELENCSVPLPPVAEQQRIVERIESLFEKLDTAKELVQSTLDSFENRKAAILHKALTGELAAKWREENGIDLNSWEEKKIKDICNVVRGGSPRPAGDPKYYEGNIPFLKVADVTRCVGPYITEFQYTIKEAGLNKTRMVEANTLLISNSGATLGVPKICSFNTTFNDGIAAFINTEGINTEFHYFFWETKTNELRAINKGAAQPNLNTDIIGNVEIKLPLIQEQEEIVRILRKLLVEEQQAQELCNIIEKIDLMKQSILARAFRGELGTNNPEEENVIELLKEVLKEKL